jgi:hypothetical protein
MRLLGTLALTAGLALVAGCSNSDSGSNANGGADGDASTGGGSGGDTASHVVLDGFVSSGPWQGSGFTATDPGAATITPDCTSGCVPPFTGSDFCMQGTVTGRADYTGFAMLGWNVNQPAGADPGTWAVPDTGGITVTVSNMPSTVALRVQVQGTDPHSGADRWCAPLTSGKLIAWSDFKTNCWQGGMPQDPLTPGTMIQQGSVMVPGLVTALPFDVCLIDLQITP